MTSLAIIAAVWGYHDRLDFGPPPTPGERRIAEAWRIGDVSYCRGAWEGAGRANAIGRAMSRHGAPLGGFAFQRRAKRRASNKARRPRPEVHVCDGCDFTITVLTSSRPECPVCAKPLCLECPF